MRASSTKLALLVGVAAAIGCGSGRPQAASAQSTEPPKAAAPAAGASTVKGSVTFSGATPAPERIKMDADPQCQLQHSSPVEKQEVVVNANGTLRNVFVYVKEGVKDKPAASTTPITLDQHGCLYSPHVLGVQVNQPIQISNSDATLHNINCKPTKSKPFNLAQPTQGMRTTKQFTAPEIMVKCACNVHPWMAAYIGVVDHPYFATTGDDGSFTIANLPAGTYTLEAWHEKYGTQTRTVTVGTNETKEVNFEFKAN